MDCPNIYNIIMFIIIIIMFFQIQKLSKNNYENATNTTPIDDAQLATINNKIQTIYNMDVEAIRNLGAISKSLLTGTNYHSTTVGTPGTLTIPADNTELKGNLMIKQNLIVDKNLIVDGTISFTNKNTLLMDILPAGIILSYNNIVPPLGWKLCDGSPGTPDLRGRFILGANTTTSGLPGGLNSRSINTKGGLETVSLSLSQIPEHGHQNIDYVNQTTDDGCCGTTKYSGPIDRAWDGHMGAAHENMPPFYALVYIIKA